MDHRQQYTISVTGATGFIGSALATELLARKFNVHRVPRCRFDIVGTQCVIHCAGRAHVIHDELLDPLTEYRRVNVEGTLEFARQSAAAGVKRFVFISSIGVNGVFTERTSLLLGEASGVAIKERGVPRFARNHVGAFTANHPPVPSEDYAISKWEAEQGLWEIASQTGMEVVVVRPPLVYGPGVKGNFARLLDLVRSGVPLPLASVNNRRSFVGLDNLVDLLICCVHHPNAAGQTLLVSDGQDFSTPELLRMIANAMGARARLFPMPLPLLRIAGWALRRSNEVDRLVGSLQVDSSATRELLGWNPSVSVQEGILRMVAGLKRA